VNLVLGLLAILLLLTLAASDQPALSLAFVALLLALAGLQEWALRNAPCRPVTIKHKVWNAAVFAGFCLFLAFLWWQTR
jgi:hypothetical protein